MEVFNLIFIMYGLTFFIALVVVSASVAVMQLLFASKMQAKIGYISFFGMIFRKDEKTGKITRGKWKFQPYVECPMYPDYKNDVGKDIFESFNRVVWLCYGAAMCLCSLGGFLVRNCGQMVKSRGGAFFWSEFLVHLGEMIIFMAALFLFYIVISSLQRNKGLEAINKSINLQMINGVPFGEMDLKPLGNMNVNSASEREEMCYDLFYIYSLLETGNTEELKPVTFHIQHLVDKKASTFLYVMFYYWLIYYYSIYQQDWRYAAKYMNMAKTYIAHDKDANGKRVLAAYEFAYGDRELARKYAEEGMSLVDQFSRGSERELEKKLLTELIEKIQESGWETGALK